MSAPHSRAGTNSEDDQLLYRGDGRMVGGLEVVVADGEPLADRKLADDSVGTADVSDEGRTACDALQISEIRLNVQAASALGADLRLPLSETSLPRILNVMDLRSGLNFVPIANQLIRAVQLELAESGHFLVDSAGHVYEVRIPLQALNALKIHLSGDIEIVKNRAYNLRTTLDTASSQLHYMDGRCMLQPVWNPASVQ